MTNLKELIIKKIASLPGGQDNPLINEHIYMIALDYIDNQEITAEDIDTLNNIGLTVEDFGNDIPLMYTTDEIGAELQLTYNHMVQQLRAFYDGELVDVAHEDMTPEDLEPLAIENCFQYYYERYNEITNRED